MFDKKTVFTILTRTRVATFKSVSIIDSPEWLQRYELENIFSLNWIFTFQTVFFEIFLDTDDYDDYEYEGLEEDDYEADTVTGS